MGMRDALRTLFSLEPFHELSVFDPAVPIETQIAQATRQTTTLWRIASLAEAMGVPAISRAVTLISNTVGSLSVQGFRDGARMADVPRLLARPNPWETPQVTYRDMAYGLATYGETVLWIGSYDRDGWPAALVVVPHAELAIRENPANRFSPIYRWGAVEGTRYSPVDTGGRFVHITYLREPGELHGRGPLQINAQAVSVAVEAQRWAANFFAEGGRGGTLIKSAVELGTELDSDGLTDADRLRAAWLSRPNNVPHVVDPLIEDVKEVDSNPQGAQMLEAREHQNGDAARIFGIPGKLLEYAAPGSSLTYQNLSEVWTDFVRGCLTPNYLEPIEAALSDLLPRSTAARFNTAGLMRADAKTRYDVYNIGVPLGIITPQEARQDEGFEPGNVEYAPVLPSPPQAVPIGVPYRASREVRCDRCHRLLAEQATPPFRFTCTNPKCRATVAVA